MHCRTVLVVSLLAAALGCAACGSSREPASVADDREGAADHAGDGSAQSPTVGGGGDPSCPATLPSAAIPGVEPHHLRLDYWLERIGREHDLDEVLLDERAVRATNQVNANPALGYGPIGDRTLVEAELRARLDWMREKLTDGTYVLADGSVPDDALVSAYVVPATLPAMRDDEVRVALDHVPIRCGPRPEGYYKAPEVNLAFDRNNCSALRAQEPVQILADWPGGMKYVRTRYTSGWIAADAPLSPPLPDALRESWTHNEAHDRVVDRAALTLTSEDGKASVEVPFDTQLPRVDAATPGHVRFATRDGFYTARVADRSRLAGIRPLTRRALLEEAFAYLDRPYGWGDQDGGLDCSRFLLDLFEGAFGVELPRVSTTQARAGTFSIDLTGVESERERELLIEAAARHGAVFLQMPGHIMLYLGRDERGEMMALHSFSEYLVPCAAMTASDSDDPTAPAKGPEHAPGETLFTVNKVTVSDLELGRGSSRTAFIERLTRITVLGKAPDVSLRGAAQLRAPAPAQIPSDGTCRDSQANAIFFSPLSPNAQQPLRVIVTSSEDPGPAELVMVAPDGSEHRPELRRLGGPPFGVVATVAEPQVGTWKAVYGDGERTVACLEVRVDSRPKARATAGSVVWEARRRWTEATENLYATWVESLFDYPVDEDLSWTSFHAVLRDPERNFFYDHYGPDTTRQYKFEPDCADLPYFVRGYYSYNMGLPFGFRRCSRGKAGKPPSCNEELTTNLSSPRVSGAERAFELFMNADVRNVHSGSGRTAPGDDQTDFYPVALDHRSLRPGTLFADPDGHLLIVARWVPQGTDRYGMLIAADAQPDNTVSRKRFWRGSFLFTPDTTNVGAGFKAFRPLVVENGTVRALTNAELDGKGGFAAYSEQQYQGSRDDFYDAMDALVNPRPLDPLAMQDWLVDALDEQVRGRIVSVDTGLSYMANHPATVEMPEGYRVFETSGAWEDYSTPSRDMRLLIAMDAVRAFADQVRRSPERFGIAPDEVDARIEELVAHRDKVLAERSFEYTRSDGSRWTLTLAQVLERQRDFEMAYNPNDCAEVRWAAPEGSDERSTCKRRAPNAQRERMERYRSWFAERQRPPR